MSGKERASFKFKGNLSVAALQRLLAQRLDVHQAMLRAVLPNGEILRQQNPKETLASVLCLEGAADSASAAGARSRSPPLRRRIRGKQTIAFSIGDRVRARGYRNKDG